jgi:hypothetical protein
MVYCGVTSPYSISSHLEEGDNSSIGDINLYAPGSYAMREETSVILA